MKKAVFLCLLTILIVCGLGGYTNDYPSEQDSGIFSIQPNSVDELNQTAELKPYGTFLAQSYEFSGRWTKTVGGDVYKLSFAGSQWEFYSYDYSTEEVGGIYSVRGNVIELWDVYANIHFSVSYRLSSDYNTLTLSGKGISEFRNIASWDRDTN